MFILDEPYVSDFLFETTNKFNFPVLNNSSFSYALDNEISKDEIFNAYKKTKKVYTNSENSIKLIKEALKGEDTPKYIELFKDKTEFRKLLSSIYPDFYYKKVSYGEFSSLDENSLKFPLVIKPAVGFLSFGVYTVYTKEEFKNIVCEIKTSLEKVKNVFPLEVLNSDNFIIEEYIEGDEYAVDTYYDDNGEPVILNVYYHPFKNKYDVSDRMYVSSAEIISKYHDSLGSLLRKIGKAGELKNFPMHIELRINRDKIVPIEINPLRFAGWCLCDLAYFAYGINIYEYFMNNKKPDWQKIAKENKASYAFVIGEIPSDINKSDIISFSLEEFKKDMKAEILNVREIDYKKKPIFCTAFIKASSYNDIKHIINLDMNKYIEKK